MPDTTTVQESQPRASAQPVRQPFRRRKITVDQWNEEGLRLFGTPARKWQFVCPACKTVQSGGDFLDLGMANDAVLSVLAYSCIGRFRHLGAKKGCDWTLGGLLQIHELEVIDENGKGHPRFEFAKQESEVPA